MAKHISDTKTVRGACPQDCPDTCAMLYSVEDGELVDVRGDPDHPYTRGYLCVKLKGFAERHYNPDRVLHPLRRVGPKGSGEFEQISWDEALSEIEERWSNIIRNDGPQAIMPYSYAGNIGTLNGITTGDAFFNRLNASISEKTYCVCCSSTAWIMTVGKSGGMDPESLAHSKYIIIWAMNMMSTNSHAWPFIMEAKKRGAKVVVIDPVRTRTAKQADWHLQIKPGTDGALALGMINEIIQKNLIDEDYVEKYTEGFEELKQRAKQFPVEWVAKITGVSADDIRQLAREFATNQPAAIRLGVAVERHSGGGQAIRAITCLPALVGAWRHPGGGMIQMPVWDFPIKWNDVARPDWQKSGTRVINELGIGAVLTGETQLDPPVKSLFVYNSNPAATAPEQSKVCKGLEREDLFTVVSELFISDTARYADIVLPATMQAEQMDLMFSWGHFYFTLNQPSIRPRGEAVSNTELFRRLAKTMGFTEPEWDRTDEQMIMDFIDWDSPLMEGITLDYLKEHGWARLKVGKPAERAPHAEGNFKTPSGKCEFKSSIAAEGNFVTPLFRAMSTEFQDGGYVDPLPGYISPRESIDTNPELAKLYPLNIVSPKPHAFINTQFANEKLQQSRQGEQSVLINPKDAAARKIYSGSNVRIFNGRGAFAGVAEVTDDVIAGVIVANMGYWGTMQQQGKTVNEVSSGKLSDLGRAGTYSDNLVQVEVVS